MTSQPPSSDKMIAAMMRLLIESGAGDEVIAHVTRSLPATVSTALGSAGGVEGPLDLLPALESVIDAAVNRAVEATLASRGLVSPQLESVAPRVESQPGQPAGKRPGKPKLNVTIGGKRTSVSVSGALLDELVRATGGKRQAAVLVQARLNELPSLPDAGERSRELEEALRGYLKLESTAPSNGAPH